MDEIDKYVKELFRDFVKHVDKPLLNEPVDLYTYEELGEDIKEGWTLFLVKEEPILAHLSENGNLFYFTRKKSLLSILDKKSTTFVIPKDEYLLRLLYIIVLDLNEVSYNDRPYNMYRSDFLNKIFYFLEIPIDGYVLSKYNIYPDIEATTIKKLISQKRDG